MDTHIAGRRLAGMTCGAHSQAAAALGRLAALGKWRPALWQVGPRPQRRRARRRLERAQRLGLRGGARAGGWAAWGAGPRALGWRCWWAVRAAGLRGEEGELGRRKKRKGARPFYLFLFFFLVLLFLFSLIIVIHRKSYKLNESATSFSIKQKHMLQHDASIEASLEFYFTRFTPIYITK
jgi:hypothetical protein